MANVGDSRGVLVVGTQKEMGPGSKIGVEALTTDHKPMEEGEHRRIIQNGGKIYQ